MGGPPPQPGQQPSPQQIAEMQRRLAEEAQKHGMTVPQYVEQLKAQAMRQHQMQAAMRQQQMQQAGGAGPPQQGQGQAIQPGPPKPEALAVANFLKSQDLKTRTCIFQEKRKDMFKVKRAIRALHSPAYEKARKKNPLLPEVTDRASAENTFKLLPLGLLALRVTKIEPEANSPQAKKKRVKGLWTVKVEQQQDAADESHYVWLYEDPRAQWRMRLYALGALVLILAVVFFPVWPYTMRLGVWYLSMGCLGLLALFFAMAIFRLILFVITMFAVPPGLWLYPNLFEDVGFFDSFKPFWGWQETPEDKKSIRSEKKAKLAAKKARKEGQTSETPDASASLNESSPQSVQASGAESQEGAQVARRVPFQGARVEEVEDE
ncbi:hypothetical protein AAFC00_002332 [Neodothiora populina]